MTRLSLRTTLLAVLAALVALAALASFIAFAPEGETGADGDAAALPAGFALIPEDVFFERVYGEQRAAQSWRYRQEKLVGSTKALEVEAVTRLEEGGDDVAASLSACCTESGGSQRLAVIVLDGTYYAQGLGTEKPWWRIDPQADPSVASAQQQLRDMVAQETGPEVQDAVLDRTVVGADRIGGVLAAHYRFTLAATAQVGQDGRPVEGATSTLDVWVDEDDRPLRIVLTSGQGPTKVQITTTYDKYGDSFPIAAPPADQTTDKAPKAPKPTEG